MLTQNYLKIHSCPVRQKKSGKIFVSWGQFCQLFRWTLITSGVEWPIDIKMIQTVFTEESAALGSCPWRRPEVPGDLEQGLWSCGNDTAASLEEEKHALGHKAGEREALKDGETVVPSQLEKWVLIKKIEKNLKTKVYT